MQAQGQQRQPPEQRRPSEGSGPGLASGSIDEQVVYDEHGLAPCVVQDWRTGEVLMLAYMNAEALARTRATGELHLYSRSRQKLWHKGETSGNVQKVRALRLDCDGDTLLALVEPAGPACHTGERTCFHRGDTLAIGQSGAGEGDGAGESRGQGEGDGWDESQKTARDGRGAAPYAAPYEVLPELERTLRSRAAERPAGSYTVTLLDDPALAGAKVREEAEEVTRAAREESDERVDEEAADLIYHLLVLIHGRGRELADAERVLDGRRR